MNLGIWIKFVPNGSAVDGPDTRIVEWPVVPRVGERVSITPTDGFPVGLEATVASLTYETSNRSPRLRTVIARYAK